MESCSLKCQKVAKNIAKNPESFNLNFYINVNQKLYFSFFTIIAYIGQENNLKLSFKELLTNMGDLSLNGTKHKVHLTSCRTPL